MKTLSVMEGDSVTLQTNVTKIQKEDLLEWKFGAEKTSIAKINVEGGSFNTYNGPDGRFRDRLQLDHQTGSLTITNIRTEHAGLYLITISGKTVTEYRFSVTVYRSAHINPVLISTVSTGSLLTIAVVWIFCICKRARKRAEEEVYRNLKCQNVPTIYLEYDTGQSRRVKEEGEVVYAGVTISSSLNDLPMLYSADRCSVAPVTGQRIKEEVTRMLVVGPVSHLVAR
ncbi:uncharacterized protein LOC113082496 [Carassius auratus]|uniref:Uncharacterized protein LOC113082496 n=1 Tax=Carassius auratus TaxID=7957 RepID=A0A6P6NLR8_CARAU|nr:uncharacterized protein LOC113082496 [Carassius auratus]